ncbi:MAG: ATP-binding protein [Acidobacteria bacterium]|nr:ATP-binding protein [Acidobacteriota bacterium]
MDRTVAIQADQLMAKRALVGGLAQILIILFGYFITQLPSSHPHASVIFAVVALSIAAVRVSISAWVHPASEAWKRWGRKALFGAVALQQAAWGGMLAFSLLALGPVHESSTFLFVTSLGVTAGSVIVFASEAMLTRILIVAMMVPPSVALFFVGGSFASNMGLCLLLYCGMMISMAGIAGHEYNRALRSTELLRARAEELEIAHQAAQLASRTKGEFVANMSHEIRTPMNGVLGMLSLVMDSELSRQQRDYIETAHNSAESLLRILNDILDFSKIDAAAMQLESRPFDPVALVRELEREFFTQMAGRGLDWRVEVPELPPVLGDVGRLRQVLVNLVGNAMKFTERGGVTLRVAELARHRSGGTEMIELDFSVTDTGIGIAPEKQQAIFDPFVQADGSVTRRTGGTGLGLSISRRFVELMGGQIGLSSEPGRGSRFFFSASFGVTTLDRSLGPAPVGAAIESNGDVWVLLVEDNLVNQKVCSQLLLKQGYQVVVANDGLEALERLRQRQFDLILMDVHMPRLDGLETTMRIREDERQSGRHVPIIALTASAMVEDREQCLAAGMDAYLAKPIQRQLLLDAIGAVRLAGPQRELGLPATNEVPVATR